MVGEGKFEEGTYSEARASLTYGFPTVLDGHSVFEAYSGGRRTLVTSRHVAPPGQLRRRRQRQGCEVPRGIQPLGLDVMEGGAR